MRADEEVLSPPPPLDAGRCPVRPLPVGLAGDLAGTPQAMVRETGEGGLTTLLQTFHSHRAMEWSREARTLGKSYRRRGGSVKKEFFWKRPFIYS